MFILINPVVVVSYEQTPRWCHVHRTLLDVVSLGSSEARTEGRVG